MEITEEQYARIKDSFPVQRGNVSLRNLQVLNAILYVAEQGCKWRGLPKRFGSWHTIYMRMNRWAKNGVLDRVFEQLQLEQIVRIRIEAFSIDSTSVKVHPDGTGALKKIYGPPPDCKLQCFERDSLRKSIRSTCGQSPDLDENPHASVLITDTAPWRAFFFNRFRMRRWTVLSSLLLLANLGRVAVVGAVGKSENAQAFSEPAKQASFPRLLQT